MRATRSKTEDAQSEELMTCGPLTPIDRIMACRRIVKNHQYEFLEDVVIDVQTANAIVTVYDALNQKNKEKFSSLPLDQMGVLAWEILSHPS